MNNYWYADTIHQSFEVKLSKLIVFCLAVPLLLGMLAGCNNNDTPTPEPTPTTKLLVNLNEVALRPRPTVEKILGKPISYTKRKSDNEIGDTATYSWGLVFYANNHMVGLHRHAPPKPYQAALQELGLPIDSKPYVRDVDKTLIWTDRPYSTGIKSPDGLVIQNAFLPGDFSEFDIWILDADDPSGWTDDQCIMWLHLSGARIPEKAMHRGDPLYWPFHHDETEQACKSHA